MTEHIISDAIAIVKVLASDSVAPPERPGVGATLALRAAMARFAGPGVHAPRRAAVEFTISLIDVDDLKKAANALTRRLVVNRVATESIARKVPTTVLAMAMKLVAGDEGAIVEGLLRDVESVVAVIGRGDRVSPESDAASERLLALAAGHRDPVALVSVLYQAFDATAALIEAMLEAARSGAPRPPVAPRTTRVAIRDGATNWTADEVVAGDHLVLEIGAAGIEFGSGPHACPGRALAELIAAAVVDAVDR